MDSRSRPIVDSVASDWVAEQKLPNPWVGRTAVASGRASASRWAEAYCAWTSSSVWSGPSRSGRPVEPKSREPPVNTPTSSSQQDSAYDRWVNVCPGVAMARMLIDGETCTTSPSRVGVRS